MDFVSVEKGGRAYDEADSSPQGSQDSNGASSQTVGRTRFVFRRTEHYAVNTMLSHDASLDPLEE